MAKRGIKIGIGVVIVAGAAVAFAVATSHVSPTIGLPHPPAAHAEVAAVVDAETVDIRADNAVTRIRLGYIATPTPPAPGFPVACLQPQAEDQLRSIIPVGTQLSLTYSTDRFGRTIAEATTLDGRLVNAELVRAGVAEAVGDPSDPAVPPAIRAAAQEALTNQRGVHAAGIACTVPGQVKALTDTIATIPTTPPAGASLQVLVGAANNATQARMAAENLASDFTQDHQDTTWAALDPNERAQLDSRVRTAVVQATSDERQLRAATNGLVNQQATDTANNREQARIAKALAEIRKAELERAVQAAHREAEARKAQAAMREAQARRDAERSREADPSESSHSADHSSDSGGSDSGSGDSSSHKKKSSSDN
jgi:endonuclease YncB( thermonuclease family)